MTMNEIDNVPLDSVRINGGTQSRVELNQSTIAEYAEAIRHGVDLPPVVMFFDGSSFWLADGFHRYHAHRQAGAMEIAAEIRTGTQRDAVLFSVGANASHGLRRTNEDKRRAVQTLLNDPEWATWTDREIAKACGVSHPFVAAVRSPAAATRQQENREVSTVSKFNKVESDSTPAAKQEVKRAMPEPRAAQLPVEPESPIATPAPLAISASDVPVAANDAKALHEQIAELSEALKSTLADNEMMGRAFDADDRLKAAMDEAKRQKAIAENAERTLAAKSGEFIERARAVTYWKNRAEKAEKKLAGLEKAA